MGVVLFRPTPSSQKHFGVYDLVVTIYHDQERIPIKLEDFRMDPQTGKWTRVSAVNITVGLPIIRGSVDHGAAFHIAGKGVPNSQSLNEDRQVRSSAGKQKDCAKPAWKIH